MSDPWRDAPDLIPRLRLLWDEGHSTSEIGRRLGLSKNSVVGKAHRLRLPSRPSPILWKGGQRPSRAIRAPRSTLAPLPSIVTRKSAQPTLDSAGEAGEKSEMPQLRVVKPAGLLLRKEQCVYLLNDGRLPNGKKGWLRCEEPAVSRIGYCEKHHKLCTTKAREIAA